MYWGVAKKLTAVNYVKWETYVKYYMLYVFKLRQGLKISDKKNKCHRIG